MSFIEGCPREWAALPRPEPPLTVGIDGCYVRQWEDKKAHFEVIVGKSMHQIDRVVASDSSKRMTKNPSAVSSSF